MLKELFEQFINSENVECIYAYSGLVSSIYTYKSNILGVCMEVTVDTPYKYTHKDIENFINAGILKILHISLY